jgi:hypothetical protein
MKTKCPRCFALLPPAYAVYVCKGLCQPEPDATATAYSGTASALPPLTEINGTLPPPGVSPSCRNGQHVAGQELCPQCHHPLPPKWREYDTIAIAMAGSRTTGKSVYVGVLVKQLRALAARAGGSLQAMDTASTDSYRDNYERVLYEARGLIPPSGRLGAPGAVHRTPLTFALQIPGEARRAIVIRDVAGEDFEQPQADTQLFSFLSNADSLFYLVDPLSVLPIQQMLYGLVDSINTQGGDPLSTLNNVLGLISATSNGGRDVRLAVVISKFDALQRLANHEGHPWNAIMGNVGAAFCRDPLATQARWDQTDSELLDAEVRGLLELLGAKPVINMANFEFEDRRFFAVSALGRAPAPGGLSLRGRGIAPYRVLDPLRWVMHGRGWL